MYISCRSRGRSGRSGRGPPASRSFLALLFDPSTAYLDRPAACLLLPLQLRLPCCSYPNVLHDRPSIIQTGVASAACMCACVRGGMVSRSSVVRSNAWAANVNWTRRVLKEKRLRVRSTRSTFIDRFNWNSSIDRKQGAMPRSIDRSRPQPIIWDRPSIIIKTSAVRASLSSLAGAPASSSLLLALAMKHPTLRHLSADALDVVSRIKAGKESTPYRF